MEKSTQNLYVREIQTQANLALRANQGIIDCLAILRDNSREWRDRQEFMLTTYKEIHSFLTHASNISKLFWPVVNATPPTANKPDKLAKWQRTTDRGDFLRTLYSMRPSNVLENRDLRNHLEHYDERLDDFSAERDLRTTGKGYADMGIGPIGGIVGPQASFILRHFDQSNGDFIFRGAHYDLPTIKRAIEEVLNNSNQLLP